MSIIQPYGVAIHKAIASRNLGEMRRVCNEAEDYLAQHGDVSAALEGLKAEITKLEAGK